MSEITATEKALTGLGCPRCGGMVPVPEGQAIVICPYCELRSSVSATAENGAKNGDKALTGVRRYQVPVRVDRNLLGETFRRFLSGKMSVARDAAAAAQITETFLVHLPFWAAWGRGVAYAFGQQQVGSGDNKRYEPREKKVIREMTWNGPACEVGEFGVSQVGLGNCPLEPFNADALHRSGMVFEPVGSAEEALETARRGFEAEIKGAAELSRVSQFFTRILRPRLGLVYYPMWVIRYLYRQRSFQVVVDGYDGQVLYGKAPGSVFFRAGALVAGMAGGAAVAIDVPALLLMMTSNSSDDEGLGGAALAAFVFGLGIMWASYRTYRYGEHYEYHRFKPKKKGSGATGAIKMFESFSSDPSQFGSQMEKLVTEAQSLAEQRKRTP